MAHYLVYARPIEERLSELADELEKGAFEDLEPFGNTITHSLRNARVTPEGRAVWEEEDYCSPPLAEERAAVLDRYFTNITVKAVDEGHGWEQIDDLPPLLTRVQD